MNFSTAQKVQATITASDEVDRLRADNRTKVNQMFDGFTPVSASVAKQMNLRVNINWLEGKVIEQQAVRQYVNNYSRQSNYFKIKCPSMPEQNRQDWELSLTRIVNKPIKRSLSYYNLLQQRFASVVRHGIAPQIWIGKEGWLPQFIAIEDLRVPTDTETSLENLVWFAARHRYTPGELAKKVFGREADKGWNKPVIAKVLNRYKDINNEQPGYDWDTSPEKMLDLYKQDMGYYMSDAVPVITVWHFYFKDNADNPLSNQWKMKVVPADFGIHGLEQNVFLYDNDEDVVAEDLSHLLHVQFGDLNGKAPFMWHSVRALGFLLMEPVFWMNLTRCRLLQHVWENFNILLRSQDPADRARAQKVELFDRGWIDPSVQIVPREERHQIDPNLVQFVMAQMKQLMSESAAAYTEDIDKGTRKERTAFEVKALMDTVNSMLMGLLNNSYQLEVFSYREICRRLTIKDSINKDAQLVWQECKKAGIPTMYLNENLWDIEPDVPLGSGNQTIEMAQAQQLMQNRGAYPGESQQKILHLFTAAVTNSAKVAEDLVPLEDKQTVNESKVYAQFAFATLMQGIPVHLQPGLNPIDQIETLLGMAGGVIARVEQNTNMATMNEIVGLTTVLQYVQGLVQQLSTDPEQKQRVKQYGDALGKLGNQIKAFEQRLQEQQQAGQQQPTEIPYRDAPPEIKRQMEQKAGFQPAQSADAQKDPKQLKAEQAMAINEAKFVANEHRETLALHSRVEREGLEHGMKMAHKTAEKKADLNQPGMED